MEAEVSCRNLRSAVEYVRQKGGPEAVGTLVRAARLVEPTLTEESLLDDTGWVSAEVFRKVLEAACRVLGDDEAARKIGAYYVKGLSLGLMAPVFRAARTPELFFAKLPKNSVRFNRVFSITVPNLNGESALVQHAYTKPIDTYGDERACAFTAGAYATVPELYGGPIASVTEISCVTRGDMFCQYVVKWKKQKGWFGWLLSLRRRRDGLLLAETTGALTDALERLERKRQELEEQRQNEERLRRHFQQYVPYQVVAKLLGPEEGGADSLAGEQRQITAFLADIRGFVDFSETHRAEDVVDTLNRFFTMASGIIEQHRGTIDKLIGDAMLAIFGAPYSFGNDADRALAAALHLKREIGRFNEQQRRLKLRPINVGICLATGHGIAGNIGSELRWDYTVIGAPINLASRLQSLAKDRGNVVLIDERTRRELHSEAKLLPVEAASIRGLADLVSVHEVLGFDERRRFLRYAIDIPAFTADAAGRLQNISLGGMLLSHPHPVAVGEEMRLTFALQGRELTCDGKVRRVSPDAEGAKLGIELPHSSDDFDADFERFAADHEPLQPPPKKEEDESN
jgi:class 3 adenylate cyclase